METIKESKPLKYKIGVEIEGLYLGRSRHFLNRCHKYAVNLTDDGSIRDIEQKNGHTFEIQSKILKTEEDLNLFFEFCRCFNSKKFYFNASCGVHIHISQNIKDVHNGLIDLFSEQKTLFKGFKFIKEGLEKDKKREFEGVLKNIVRDYAKMPLKNLFNRYQVINVSNSKGHNTIEYRLYNFVEVKNKVKALKTFVDLSLKCCDYISNISEKEIYKTTINDEDLKSKPKEQINLIKRAEIPIIKLKPADKIKPFVVLKDNQTKDTIIFLNKGFNIFTYFTFLNKFNIPYISRCSKSLIGLKEDYKIIGEIQNKAEIKRFLGVV